MWALECSDYTEGEGPRVLRLRMERAAKWQKSINPQCCRSRGEREQGCTRGFDWSVVDCIRGTKGGRMLLQGAGGAQKLK